MNVNWFGKNVYAVKVCDENNYVRLKIFNKVGEILIFGNLDEIVELKKHICEAVEFLEQKGGDEK